MVVERIWRPRRMCMKQRIISKGENILKLGNWVIVIKMYFNAGNLFWFLNAKRKLAKCLRVSACVYVM